MKTYSIDQIKEALKYKQLRLKEKSKELKSRGYERTAECLEIQAEGVCNLYNSLEEIFSEVFPEGGDKDGQ